MAFVRDLHRSSFYEWRGARRQGCFLRVRFLSGNGKAFLSWRRDLLRKRALCKRLCSLHILMLGIASILLFSACGGSSPSPTIVTPQVPTG